MNRVGTFECMDGPLRGFPNCARVGCAFFVLLVLISLEVALHARMLGRHVRRRVLRVCVAALLPLQEKRSVSSSWPAKIYR